MRCQVSYLLTILYCHFSFLAGSQSLPVFEYTVNDGLPSSSIYECLQDSEGYIWLATESGLSRFDGYSFKNYSIKDGLKVNDVWGLFEDSQNRIWIRSFSPYLSYFQRDKIHHILLPASLDAPGVHRITETADGTLWFSFNRGIVRLDTNDTIDLIKYPDESTDMAGFLAEDEDGQWFLTSEKIILRTTREEHSWALPVGSEKILKITRTLDKTRWLIFLSDRIIVFESHTGNMSLVSLDTLLGEGHRIKNVIGHSQNIGHHWLWTNKGRFALRDDLSVDSTFAFKLEKYFEFAYQDREDNLWMCGRGTGLLFLPAIALKTKMINYRADSSGESFKALCFLNLGKELLIGTYRGVLRMDQAGSLKCVTGSWDGTVRAMYWHKEANRIILATEKTLLYLPLTELAHVREWEEKATIFSIEEKELYQTYSSAPRGSIGMFGKNGHFDTTSQKLTISAGNGIAVMDFSMSPPTFTKLSAKRSYACYTTDTLLWYGRTNGIGCITPDYQDHFPFSEDSLMKVSVLDLQGNNNGVLWVGSDGYGLFGYHSEEQEYFKIRELENSVVKRIIVHEDHTLWVSSNKGVCRIQIHSYIPFSYTLEILTSSTGLVSNEVNTLCFFKKRLIVGTNQGTSVFKPGLYERSATIPKMTVSKITVDGKELSAYKKARLEYNQNDLVFYFSGLLFRNPEAVNYYYRLKGQSNKWKVTSEHSVSFHNLEPGSYRFEIKALTTDGLKSVKPALWEFEIQPHWTQMALVKHSVVLAVIGMVLLALLAWHKSQKVKLRFQKEISSLQTEALQAQMNPHFIFNALNSIQYMIGVFKADEATEYLALFGRLIRLNIEMSHEKRVPLQKEIECLQLYLELEKMRFGDRLNVLIETDPSVSTSEVLIPGLILQPFVELLLAGRSATPNGLDLIRISVTSFSGYISIDLLSPGYNKERHVFTASKRIQGIQKRFKLLYGKLKDVELVEIVPFNSGKHGLKVKLMIPQTIDTLII